MGRSKYWKDTRPPEKTTMVGRTKEVQREQLDETMDEAMDFQKAKKQKIDETSIRKVASDSIILDGRLFTRIKSAFEISIKTPRNLKKWYP
ncbi:hypothetical protein KEM48_003419 [Puccinia striiformis f. sp. tritici PST-130]|nr:hypothetical protein KEM48_003419 [Puccinia striiformis f. sp. tritici PST-130]